MKRKAPHDSQEQSERERRSFDFDEWVRAAPPVTPEEHAQSPVDTGPDRWSAYAARDAAVLKILSKREGEATDVTLSSGQVMCVFNIAWGYDLGDPVAHVTANISPPPEEKHAAGFFFTDEVVRIVDPETGVAWFDAEK
jgi:hypothetical protein